MLTIEYFGEIAEKTGKNIEKIDLEKNTLEGVIEAIKVKYDLKKEDFQVALNHELVEQSEDRQLDATDEIALLSAFAGG